MPTYNVELSRQIGLLSTDEVGVKSVPAASEVEAAVKAIERAAGAYPNWAGATIFDTGWEATDCQTGTRVYGGKSWTVKDIIDTVWPSAETSE